MLLLVVVGVLMCSCLCGTCMCFFVKNFQTDCGLLPQRKKWTICRFVFFLMFTMTNGTKVPAHGEYLELWVTKCALFCFFWFHLSSSSGSSWTFSWRFLCGCISYIKDINTTSSRLPSLKKKAKVIKSPKNNKNPNLHTCNYMGEATKGSCINRSYRSPNH